MNLEGSFPIVLACTRGPPARIVMIQTLDEDDSETACSRVQWIQCHPHRTFPRLVAFYVHEGRHYLVWEEWEASVMEVMASEFQVTEPEILEIVWEVSALTSYDPFDRCSPRRWWLRSPFSAVAVMRFPR